MAVETLAAVGLSLCVLWLVLHPLLKPGIGETHTFEPLDPEETPKGVALAALKEIEFDRETGKLSDADYEFLRTRYTAAAVEALRDERGSGPNDIEALIDARVRSLRSNAAATSLDNPATLSPRPNSTAPLSCEKCGPRPEPDAVYCSSCGCRVAFRSACDRCGARLSPDSKYCEMCGREVAA
jgi:ribosomal protein L40E